MSSEVKQFLAKEVAEAVLSQTGIFFISLVIIIGFMTLTFNYFVSTLRDDIKNLESKFYKAFQANKVSKK